MPGWLAVVGTTLGASPDDRWRPVCSGRRYNLRSLLAAVQVHDPLDCAVVSQDGINDIAKNLTARHKRR